MKENGKGVLVMLKDFGLDPKSLHNHLMVDGGKVYVKIDRAMPELTDGSFIKLRQDGRHAIVIEQLKFALREGYETAKSVEDIGKIAVDSLGIEPYVPQFVATVSGESLQTQQGRSYSTKVDLYEGYYMIRSDKPIAAGATFEVDYDNSGSHWINVRPSEHEAPTGNQFETFEEFAAALTKSTVKPRVSMRRYVQKLLGLNGVSIEHSNRNTFYRSFETVDSPDGDGRIAQLLLISKAVDGEGRSMPIEDGTACLVRHISGNTYELYPQPEGTAVDDVIEDWCDLPQMLGVRVVDFKEDPKAGAQIKVVEMPRAEEPKKECRGGTKKRRAKPQVPAEEADLACAQ